MITFTFVFPNISGLNPVSTTALDQKQEQRQIKILGAKLLD